MSVSLPLAIPDRGSSSNSREETVDKLRLLAAEITLGLLFLHRNGIVHQDIKPANIMISSTGHAVIGDFGAASRLPPSSLDLNHQMAMEAGTTRTEANRKYEPIVLQAEDFVTFTPLYAAPEMRQRNSEGLVVYDERADWWSLGVLLYELVTGKTPFSPAREADALRRLNRSDGDQSRTFGELETLTLSYKSNGDCLHLEDFLRSVRFTFLSMTAGAHLLLSS